jgi:hypothetical protein
MKKLSLCNDAITRIFKMAQVKNEIPAQAPDDAGIQLNRLSFEVNVTKKGDGYAALIKAILDGNGDSCVSIRFEQLLNRPARLDNYVISADDVFYEEEVRGEVCATIWEAYLAEHGTLTLFQEEGCYKASLKVDVYLAEVDLDSDDIKKLIGLA